MKLELLLEMKFQKLEEKVGKGKITEDLFNQIHEKIEEHFPENLLNNYVIGWCTYWIKYGKDTTETQFLEFLDHFCEVAPQTWDWNAYRTWLAITERIDFLITQNTVKDKSGENFNYRDVNQPGFLWKSDDGKCFLWKATSVHDTIRFGKGFTFCISRPGISGNMYWNYKFSKASSFHFLWNDNYINKDEWITVIDHTRYGYEFTHKNNSTGDTTNRYNKSLDQFISKYPEVKPIKTLVTNIPVSDNEQAEYNWARELYNQRKSFDKLNKAQQLNYLKYGWNISDPSIKLWELDKDCLATWINFGHDFPGIVNWNYVSDNLKTRWLKTREQNNLSPNKPTTVEIIWNYNDYPKLLDDAIELHVNTKNNFKVLTKEQLDTIPQEVYENNELLLLTNTLKWEWSKNPNLTNRILEDEYDVTENNYNTLKTKYNLIKYPKFLKANSNYIKLNETAFIEKVLDSITNLDEYYTRKSFIFNEDLLYNLPNEIVGKYPNIVNLPYYNINVNRPADRIALSKLEVDRYNPNYNFLKNVPANYLYKDVKLFKKLLPHWIYTPLRPNDIEFFKKYNMKPDMDNILNRSNLEDIKSCPELWLLDPYNSLKQFVCSSHFNDDYYKHINNWFLEQSADPLFKNKFDPNYIREGTIDINVLDKFPYLWYRFKEWFSISEYALALNTAENRLDYNNPNTITGRAFKFLKEHDLLKATQYPEDNSSALSWINFYYEGKKSYVSWAWTYEKEPKLIDIAILYNSLMYPSSFKSIPKDVLKARPELWKLNTSLWSYEKAPEALPYIIESRVLLPLSKIRGIPEAVRKADTRVFLCNCAYWTWDEFPEGLEIILRNYKTVHIWTLRRVPEEVLINTIKKIGTGLAVNIKNIPEGVVDKLKLKSKKVNKPKNTTPENQLDMFNNTPDNTPDANDGDIITYHN